MVTVVKEDMEVYGSELLELRNDFVFKSFFTDERNNRLLLHFVNSILGGTIKSLQLIDPMNTKKYAVDKLSIMDLRATTELGEQINIEMQLERHTAFNERMLYYWASLYSSQIKSTDPYGQLKKVIQIIISDLLPIKDIHSTFQIIEPKKGLLFSKHLEIHVIQLPKELQKPLDDMNTLEKWLLFFRGNQKMKEEIAMESSAYKEAFEEIRKLSMDPETFHLALSREIALRDHIQRMEDAEKLGLEKGIERGIEQGIQQGVEKGREIGIAKGIEQGIEQGKEQTKKAFVLKMHDESLPLELICKLADLTAEQVQNIIDNRANQ
ncbi:Rpn family recombination-promoting nuclease/putative transposase [Sporosarcina saromensis]|uniref:Rpn family recombination-promoting nuclease/putative transposase n=1 Tax=Sporosarcina saromensis TaxID=359365 RepID=A0ABU4GAX6_9BACL|nr:Rpn family recombination-promoting nuclease/putative transposase [Sporosarcina saromensis]MDW0113470.1 Rpn family recombination-promoting nuclease/putative transposase [Sporosarcina saromensis]